MIYSMTAFARRELKAQWGTACLLYTSDAADE